MLLASADTSQSSAGPASLHLALRRAAISVESVAIVALLAVLLLQDTIAAVVAHWRVPQISAVFVVGTYPAELHLAPGTASISIVDIAIVTGFA